MQEVAVERRGDAVTMDALMRVKTLLLLLSDLIEAARRAAKRSAEAPGQSSRARGGVRRRGLTAIGELIHAIFKIYADIRERYPESGPKPKFGGPMLRFVKASLVVIDPSLARKISEVAIRGHFESWRRR